MKDDLSSLRDRIQRKIEQLGLNLRGMTVLTEGATGRYAVTPVIALLADADMVYAYARASEFGSIAQIKEEIDSLAPPGYHDRLHIIEDIDASVVSKCDIVTNSGHLRPIGREIILNLKKGAIISLMLDDWEFRHSDVDLELCSAFDIPVIALNEDHPDLDLYKTNTLLVLQALDRIGIEVFDSFFIVITDNIIGRKIENSLASLGASVKVIRIDRVSNFGEELLSEKNIDGLITAVWEYPERFNNLMNDLTCIDAILKKNKRIQCIHLFGGIDVDGLKSAGIASYPPQTTQKYSMPMGTCETGYNAVISLQTGGLKAGEIACRLYDETQGWQATFKELGRYGLIKSVMNANHKKVRIQ